MNKISEFDITYYKNSAIEYSTKIFFGILILIVSILIAKFVNYKFKNIITEDNSKNNNTKKKMLIYNFIADLLYYAIIIIGIILFLLIFGIQLNTILILFASIGIAIELAIQGTIKEIISGLTILVFNYYNIGDLIEVNSVRYYVRTFNLFNTTFNDMFGVKVIVPNSIISTSSVRIISGNKTIYTDIFVSISANNSFNYTSLFNSIKNEILEKSEYIQDDKIFIELLDMSTFGTKIWIRVLINSVDYYNAKLSINLIVRDLLERYNILLLDEGYTSNSSSS